MKSAATAKGKFKSILFGAIAGGAMLWHGGPAAQAQILPPPVTDHFIQEGESHNGVLAYFVDKGIYDVHTGAIACGDDSASGGPSAIGVLVAGPTIVEPASGALGEVQGDCFYGADGEYTARFEVYDDDSGLGSSETTVHVENAAPEVAISSLDAAVTEGGSVAIAFSATDPGADDATLNYVVDWGDGSVSAGTVSAGGGASGSHVYADDDDCGAGPGPSATCTVSVTVTDSDGATGFDSETVTVNNAAPQVSIGPLSNSNEGQSKTISVSISDLGVLDTHTGTIYWGDGQATSISGAGSFSHTYADDDGCESDDVDAQETCTIAVTVSDDDSGSGSAQKSFILKNVAPTVTARSAASTVEGGSVTGVFASFTDPGADTFASAVNCDAGSVGTTANGGSSISGGDVLGDCAFLEDGAYTVSATVSDDDTGVGSSSFSVSVANVAPSISAFSVTGSVNEGSFVQVSASASDPGSDDQILNYQINWGDGSISSGTTASGAALNVSHLYEDEDDCEADDVDASETCAITITVTDSDGASDSASSSTEVLNVAPVLDASAYLGSADLSIDEGDTLVVNNPPINWSDVGTPDTITGTIVWGDGSSSAATITGSGTGSGTVSGSHLYADDEACGPTDVCAATVTVGDDDTGTDSVSFSVAVSNVGPSVSAGPNVAASEGAAFTVTASFTDPAGNLDRPYTATLSGAGLENSVVVNDVAIGYNAGVYTVTFSGAEIDDDYDGSLGCAVVSANVSACALTITVTDDDGGVGSDSLTATITNVDPNADSIAQNGPVAEGSPASVSANFSDVSNNDTAAGLTYASNCGDPLGSASNQAGAGTMTGSLDCTYTDNGTYTVTIAGTDKDGGSDSISTSVVVTNVPPAVTAGADVTTNEGSAATISATFTDAGKNDTHTATADWGNGNGPQACTVVQGAGSGSVSCTNTYQDNDICGASPSASDVCAVTIKVCDDDGGCGSDALNVTVNNVNPLVLSMVSIGGSATNEGAVKSYTITFRDPALELDDAYTVDVDWGDGKSDSYTITKGGSGWLPAGLNQRYNVSHIYTDDYDVSSGGCLAGPGATAARCRAQVTITDVDGGASAPRFSPFVTINNVAPAVTSATTTSGVYDEGSTISVSMSAEDQGCEDTHTATIDWGDGTVESGAVAETVPNCGGGANGHTVTGSHEYGDNGGYNVCVTTTDKDGQSASSCQAISIDNVNPTIASVSADPNPVDEGSPTAVTVTFTDPGWLDTHEQSATCGFSGADLDSSVLSEENAQPDSTGTITATCTYGHASSGGYEVTVEVCDDDGGCDSDTISIEVLNVAPTLSAIAADPQPVDEGSALTLTASFTDPSWLDTHTTDVDCGFSGADLDSNVLVEENARPDSTGSIAAVCTYGHAGTYTVTMTVTDDLGDSDTQTLVVEVSNVAPTLSAIAADPQPVDEGSALTLTASFTDPSWLDTHTTALDCGFSGADLDSLSLTEENARPNSTGDVTGVCTYGHAGVYTVTMTVTDDTGDSDTQTLEVTVENVPPTLSAVAADPNPVDEGSPVALSATFTDPSWLDTHTSTVDCGFSGADLDGNDLTEENARPDSTGSIAAVCTYGHAGTYTASVTVTDDLGGSDTQTVDIEVLNVPPTIAAIADITTDEQDVSFSTTFTDPSWLDTHTADVSITCDTPEVCGTAANNGTVYTQATFDANSLVALTEENIRPDSTGTIDVTAKVSVGVYTVTVTVTDDLGDSDSATFELTVQDDFAPNAEILFPDCDATSGLCKIINVAVPVIGTADDDNVGDGDTPSAPSYPFNSPDTFESYSVDIAAGHGADCGNDSLFTTNVSSGSSSVTNGYLGTLDPQALGLNGEYTLRVHVEERSAQYTHPNDSDACVCLTALTAPDLAVAGYGSKGNGFGEFNGPVDVAANADGSLLYVADRQNDRVQVIDRANNAVVTAIDVENKPMGVALDEANGKLYVAEGLNSSVGVYDGSTYAPGAIDNGGHTNGVAVDGAGNVWAVDSQNGILNRYPAGSASADKSIVLGGGAFSAGRPSGIDVTGSGDDALIYVAERQNDAVNVYDVDGALVCSVTGEPMNKPEGVAVNPEGFIYVGDRNNNRILKFAPCDSVPGPINVAIFGPEVGNGLSDLNKAGGIATIGTETICFANENGANNSVDCMTYPDATPSGPQALDASGATQTAGSQTGNNNNAGNGNGKGNGKP